MCFGRRRPKTRETTSTIPPIYDNTVGPVYIITSNSYGVEFGYLLTYPTYIYHRDTQRLQTNVDVVRIL